MAPGLQTIIYPVKDLDRAKALFTALLGVEPHTDEPYYVGFSAAGQEVGLDPNGPARGLTQPVPYWHVEDAAAAREALIAAGAEAGQPITDVGGGKLTATVTDTDGNVVGLIQEP